MGHDYTQSCARCGLVFQPGQTRYLVTINVVADFDGTIGPAPTAGELERLWSDVEQKSEQELLDEVYQKMTYVICKPCRDSWVSSPLGEALAETTAAGHLH
jgi:hypothetical protein